MMKRPSPRVLERLAALRRRFERDDPHDSILPLNSPVDVLFGGGRPRKIFYFTKRGIVHQFRDGGLIDPEWILIFRYVMPTQEAIDFIRYLVRGFGASLTFVGDLDPLDLNIYAALQAGSPDFAETAEPMTVAYAGIDDEWLALADKFRLKSGPPPEFSQHRLEREHFKVVRELIPGLEALLGSRSFELLRAGKKVELEGAFGSGFYKREFYWRIADRLDAKAEHSMDASNPKRPRSRRQRRVSAR